MPHNEIEAEAFFSYINEMKLCNKDRVIVNGGEPFLHTQIDQILHGLKKIQCEVLIYTNGRLLKSKNFSQLNDKYRFVVPIHGTEKIHDTITGIPGSYKETISGLKHLVNTSECEVDIKLILNPQLMESDPDGTKLMNSFDTDIVFNNAIHLTKMADTIVSKRHDCRSISNDEAAGYTNIYFDYFAKRNVKVKLFDTCIKDITGLDDAEYHRFEEELIVYFKDYSQFGVMNLSRQILECYEKCKFKNKCVSAVNEYKALVFTNGKFVEELE